MVGHDEHDNLLVRFVRVAVPWVALIVVAALVFGFLTQYRGARERAQTPAAGETTASAEPTPTVEGEEGAAGAPSTPDASTEQPSAESEAASGQVRVLTEGLNLRSRPISSATVVKKLKKDTMLQLIEKTSGWYHVVDPSGDEGWVAAGGRYTELVE